MARTNRVFIIGLDGMSAEAMEAVRSRGVAPRLARLVDAGVSGTMASTVPPCTCPAWPTMCMGLDPGRHGLFSFVRREAGGRQRIVTTADMPRPRFWQVAAEAGRRCAVLFVPAFFPADPVEPLSISGYPAQDRPGAGMVYPPQAEQTLRERVDGFEPANVSMRWSRAHPDETDLQAQARSIREKADADCDRILACFEYASREPLDLAMVVFSLPDHLFHPYYGYLVAPDDAPDEVLAIRQAMDGAIGRMDAAIGRMLDRFGEPATVLIVSDHGFTRKTGTVYVAEVLRRAGLLKPAVLRYVWQRVRGRRKVRGFRARLHATDAWNNPRIHWDATRVFPGTDHEGGLFVNLRGRNPNGVVSPQDYDAVRDRAVEALLAVRDPETGQPPFRAVHRREDVYAGPYVELAPDLATDLSPGWHMRTKLLSRFGRRPPVHRASGLAGIHTREAILVAAGAPVRRDATGPQANLADITPTVLGLMGLEPPGDLDGRLLEEVFVFPAERRPVDMGKAEGPKPPAVGEGGYSQQDQEAMTRRLEDLGYL